MEEEIQSWIREHVNNINVISPALQEKHNVLQSLLKRREMQMSNFLKLCQSVAACEEVVKELYNFLELEYRDTDSEDESTSGGSALPLLPEQHIYNSATSNSPDPQLSKSKEKEKNKKSCAILKNAVVELKRLNQSQIARTLHRPPSQINNSDEESLSDAESDVQWQPEESSDSSLSDFNIGPNKRRKIQQNKMEERTHSTSQGIRKSAAVIDGAKTRKLTARKSTGAKAKNTPRTKPNTDVKGKTTETTLASTRKTTPECNATKTRTSEANTKKSKTSEATINKSKTSKDNTMKTKTSEAKTMKSKTSKENATKTKTSEANKMKSKTSKENTTKTKTSEANKMKSKTSEANTMKPKASEDNTTKTKTSEANTTKTKTSEANTMKSKASEDNTTKTKTSEANTMKPKASEDNTTKTKTSEANAMKSKASEDNTTKTKTSEANTTKTKTSEANTMKSKASEDNTTKTKTSEANTTKTKTSEANAMKSKTSEAKTTKTKTSEVNTMKSKASEDNTTKNKTSEDNSTKTTPPAAKETKTTPEANTTNAKSKEKTTSTPTVNTTAACQTLRTAPLAPVQEVTVNMNVLARKRELSWQHGKITEIITKDDGRLKYKVTFKEKGKSLVSGHHIAFDCMPKVEQLFVGARVVVKYETEKPEFMPGFMAELPNRKNRMRFLVFVDNHTPVYVGLPLLHLVCKPMADPFNDIFDKTHQTFMREYMKHWPYPPQTHYKAGQIVNVDCDGPLQKCEVVNVDCTLIEVSFKSDDHKEWLYRGSMRLEHSSLRKKVMSIMDEEKKSETSAVKGSPKST